MPPDTSPRRHGTGWLMHRLPRRPPPRPPPSPVGRVTATIGSNIRETPTAVTGSNILSSRPTGAVLATTATDQAIRQSGWVPVQLNDQATPAFIAAKRVQV